MSTNSLPLDERLKSRYGQARFNPSQGQAQMSFQEWLDRHPALTQSANFNEGAARAKYEDAVSQSGGEKFQAANPDWQTRNFAGPKMFTDGSTNLSDTGTATANPGSGPDAPPGAYTSPAAKKPGFQGTYKDWLAKHGGKSTAYQSAMFSKASGRKLTGEQQSAIDTRNKNVSAARRRQPTQPVA